MRTIFTALLIVGLASGGAVYYWHHVSLDHTVNYRTSQVKRGDLLITIGASGTLEPEEVIDVGAQVAGRILEFGKDPRGETDPAFKDKDIDYCSPVHKGMMLAQIDKSLYQATNDSAAAALAHDKADLLELAAKRDQTEAEWKRAQALRELNFANLTSSLNSMSQSKAASPTKANSGAKGTSPAKYESIVSKVEAPIGIKGISDGDYILAKANFEVAAAYLEEGRAAVKQDEATLTLAATNLRYTTILSPVEGTIIDRRVNLGQTVVSSLNAPSLFLLARDLRQMQVLAAVNEADIGRLKIGTQVRFTVDAYPEDEFHGVVFQIRLNAISTQNVVTYTVVVNTRNDDLRLLPYLTADVKFEVDRRDNVLLVPNGALRWQPTTQQIHPDVRDTLVAQAAKDTKDSKGNGSEHAHTDKTSAAKDGGAAKPADDVKGDDAAKDKNHAANAATVANDGKSTKGRKKRDHHGTIWVKDGNFVRPVEVRVGATDGTNTEVGGPAVKEDMEVVLGEIRNDRPADTTNPFAPKIFRGKTANPSQGHGQNSNPGGK